MSPRRREPVEQGPDTRTKLLDAAAKVFAEKGFAASSVDDVAAAAGMSKGAVYWNFDSKDDLIETLLDERVLEPLRTMIEFTKSAPAEQPTATAAGDAIAALADQREILQLFHEQWLAAAREPEQRERNAELLRELRDALGEALDARREHLGVPELEIKARDIATAYVALAQGMWLIGLVDPKFFPRWLYGEIVALVYEGLVARLEGHTDTKHRP
jgi:AcrR family transcriptional regulator